MIQLFYDIIRFTIHINDLCVHDTSLSIVNRSVFLSFAATIKFYIFWVNRE